MDLDPRNWSDEHKSIGMAVLVIALFSIGGTLADVGFGVRTFIAVLAGFIALVITSYLLTGAPIPPDDTER